MKTKLLRKIRRDKRFTVYHDGAVFGYPYSGRWACHDKTLKKFVRHKRLKNILDWLVKVYVWQFWMRIAVAFFGLAFIYTVIAVILKITS